jgi:hypothetical protein
MDNLAVGDQVIVLSAVNDPPPRHARVVSVSRSSVRVRVPGRGVLSFGRSGKLWGYSQRQTSPLFIRVPSRLGGYVG